MPIDREVREICTTAARRFEKLGCIVEEACERAKRRSNCAGGRAAARLCPAFRGRRTRGARRHYPTSAISAHDTRWGAAMSVAMTNCGEAGWLSDRGSYRYDRIDPETGRAVAGDATAF